MPMWIMTGVEVGDCECKTKGGGKGAGLSAEEFCEQVGKV